VKSHTNLRPIYQLQPSHYHHHRPYPQVRQFPWFINAMRIYRVADQPCIKRFRCIFREVSCLGDHSYRNRVIACRRPQIPSAQSRSMYCSVGRCCMEGIYIERVRRGSLESESGALGWHVRRNCVAAQYLDDRLCLPLFRVGKVGQNTRIHWLEPSY